MMGCFLNQYFDDALKKKKKKSQRKHENMENKLLKKGTFGNVMLGR